MVYETDGIYGILFNYDYDGTLIGFTWDSDVGDGFTGTDYFYLRNQQGDITTIIDGSGYSWVKYRYDAYGKCTILVDNSANDFLSEHNPYTYRGYRYDSEIGLYYLNSRYYNPVIGRFLNSDGLLGNSGDILSTNMYTYCLNNPVMNLDSSGCMPQWLSITLSVAGVVAITAFVVAAVIVSAGAAGAAVAALATVYGASAATAATLATITTAGAYVVATGIALVGLSNAGEVITGHNVIRDDFFGGNQQAYDGLQMTLSVLAAGVVFLGEVGRSMQTTSPQRDGPGAMTYKPNLKYVRDSYLEKNGINPHLMKADVLGSDVNIAHFDTYVDKNSGELFLCPKSGTGAPISTDYYLPTH